MKPSREYIAIICFSCAVIASGAIAERSRAHSLLDALLGLGLVIYYQNPHLRPRLTRLLKVISVFLIAYIAVVGGIAAYEAIVAIL